MYTSLLSTLVLLFLLAKLYPLFGIDFFGFLLENMVPEEERREWHSCVNIKVEYSKMNRS